MKTNWDSYYDNPIATSGYSRRVMRRNLINLMKNYTKNRSENFELAEFGGANSCFFDAIYQSIQPQIYHVVDNNKTGLDKLIARVSHLDSVKIHHCDVLALDLNDSFDLTFSVGLIEHFNESDTAKVVMQHFASTKAGGIVILTFPTPTFLYRITRFFAEKLKLWIFHDERPLLPDEVISTTKTYGNILYQKTVWSIFLTQHIIVIQKKA
ncbi:MAG: class I SAM-dependent methyltransferase [Legionellales bacterium]|nr:class I SAM-dependent methyltransferase [Legionellales bacterium]